MSQNAIQNRRGAALVVVLAMVVLISGLILAFFSKVMLEQQISSSNSGQVKMDLFTQGAVDQIIGDLKQEIVAGSQIYTDPNDSTYKLYSPKTTLPQAAVPSLVGPSSYQASYWKEKFPNLVKQSAYRQPFYSELIDNNGAKRAVEVSTDQSSANGRKISKERWNKALLLGGNVMNDFKAPDWILVSRNGSNYVGPWDNKLKKGNQGDAVVGRYAYAIYNEGGLLDANVAGYPSVAKSTAPAGIPGMAEQTRYKSSLTYADLTEILSQDQINALVAWRNEATIPASANSADQSLSFFKWATANPFSFLKAANPSLVGAHNSSDRLFTSRQQLIDFFQEKLPGNKTTLRDSLQYFGTFSRFLSQPSYYPDPDRPKVWKREWIVGDGGNVNATVGNNAFGKDDDFNPVFRKIRVTNTSNSKKRYDGSSLQKGEPLVKKRFALNRIAWITHKGPSAENMSDPIVKQLIRLMGGDPLNSEDPVTKFVAQGSKENISKYFGLEWKPNAGKPYWKYEHAFPNSIATLAQVNGDNREPDFFELLKASIHAGSLGFSEDGIGTNNGSGPTAYIRNSVHQESTQVENQIIQIGANIIDQFWPENFPTRIVFNDGFGNASFWGKVDLPYFYGNVVIGILVEKADPAAPSDGAHVRVEVPPSPIPTLQNPGKVVALDVPILWNPHALSMPALENGTSPTELRVCVSNFNVVRGEAIKSDANSFRNLILPKTFDNTPGNPTQIIPANVPIGIFGNNNLGFWNTGSWDEDTGTILMLKQGELNNTALYFDNPSLGALQFREPTLLMRNKGGLNLTIDNQNLIVTRGLFNKNGVPELDNPDSPFLGFYIGTATQRWVQKGEQKKDAFGNPVKDPVTNQDIYYYYTYTVGRIDSKEVTRTLSLEYKSGNEWLPYHQISVRDESNVDPAPVAYNFDAGGSGYNKHILDVWRTPDDIGAQKMKRKGMMEYDPRSRHGFGGAEVLVGDFIDADKTRIKTFKPDANFQDGSRSIMLGGLSGSMLKDNNLYSLSADTTTSNSAAGRVLRRSAGAYVGSGTVGAPVATVEGVADNSSNRPIILHRPFRNVGELGYVFSEAPWKNLDFFTPESGDVALLDTFCISEKENDLVAGKVDLNTRQNKVLQAILLGANRNELNSGTDLDAQIDKTEAKDIAQVLIDRTSGGKPLKNISELVGAYSSNGNSGSLKPAPYDGFSKDLIGKYSSTVKGGRLVKRLLETSIRSLSSSGQAGTWNLMIDVIAQTGHYPASADSIDDFMVEGERRYWVHLAIDRQTGKIIDQQIEAVFE